MITVNNLVKRFGNIQVIKGVSMDVAAGSVSAIIGPSGAGKSTFLRCINGLESFDEGRIQLEDLVLTSDLDPRNRENALRSIRRRVGMVFQQFNLFPHL